MDNANGPGIRLTNGAAAGLLATVCMSAVMLTGRWLGPTPKLPPRKIVEKGLREAGLSGEEPAINMLAVLAHLGFGALAGGLFGLVQERSPWSPVAKGVAFGLSVWALSYQGWIPALEIMPPGHRDEPRRALTMVAAHVVYGAVVGMGTDTVSNPR